MTLCRPRLHADAQQVVQGRTDAVRRLNEEGIPSGVLVAPLADDPKFNGMRPGALAWLRARRAR